LSQEVENMRQEFPLNIYSWRRISQFIPVGKLIWPDQETEGGDDFNSFLSPLCARCSAHLIKLDRSLLNAELNPIYHLLALLGAHHIFHISRIRVKHLSDEHNYLDLDCNTVSLFLISICMMCYSLAKLLFKHLKSYKHKK